MRLKFLTHLFGRRRRTPFRPDRLYFVTRSDLLKGRQSAQLIHAMDCWCAKYGPQQGTVIVYEVPDEAALMAVHEDLEGHPCVLFREPDLDHQGTALVTSHGPLELSLLKSARRRRQARREAA